VTDWKKIKKLVTPVNAVANGDIAETVMPGVVLVAKEDRKILFYFQLYLLISRFYIEKTNIEDIINILIAFMIFENLLISCVY
jgi:hypothetical protein